MAAYAMKIDIIVRKDDTAQMDRAIQESLDELAREAAQEYLSAVVDRVQRGDVPGPGLSPATIAQERAMLKAAGLPTDTATEKWRFMDKAVEDATILTMRMGNKSAKAEIQTPDDPPRRLKMYHALEFGGVNGAGRVIPPRPLWTTTADQEFRPGARTLERVRRTLDRRMKEFT